MSIELHKQMSIPELISAVRMTMLRLRYSSATLCIYDCIWKDFTEYCNRQNIAVFDETIGNRFALECYGHQIGDTFSISQLNAETVQSFLNWLEDERGNSITTRNQRLGAIHSFCRYLEINYPQYLINIQSILSIQMKKAPKPTINYLSHDGIKLLFSQPNQASKQGLRDLIILTMLYDVGARASEITDIRLEDLFLQNPASIRLRGKGNKFRQVPLMSQVVALTKKYLETRKSYIGSEYLFINPSGQKLTRGGITYILQKYCDRARLIDSNLIPKKISPHCLRHSKAMHLLQSGVNLIYIRDFLGHADIKTTEIYAKANPEMKRNALERAYAELAPKIDKDWTDDNDIMEWLKSF